MEFLRAKFEKKNRAFGKGVPDKAFLSLGPWPWHKIISGRIGRPLPGWGQGAVVGNWAYKGGLLSTHGLNLPDASPWAPPRPEFRAFGKGVPDKAFHGEVPRGIPFEFCK